MEKTELFINKMRHERIPGNAIDVFVNFYRRLADGFSATIPESAIVPLKSEAIADRSDLCSYEAKGHEALAQTAVIKLNGGLGTTMGLQGPKSLINAKNGLTFLAVTLQQIRHMNRQRGLTVPLVLMNSFFTDSDTRNTLLKDGSADLVRYFTQHKFPKILETTLEPVSYPEDPSLEWHPAGHGDLLLSLENSGLLSRLLQTGCRYLFISNIDNLGAEIDPCILGYFAGKHLDFLMEITDRTEMDRKGGHPARLKNNGRLILREAAQCDPADSDFFSDIGRHPFFNTNNVWISCEAAQRIVREGKNADILPVINRKSLRPHDSASPAVFHLESALGSAISLFDNGAAVRVPRSRFTPVKTCEELLLLWSDCYLLRPDGRLRADTARASAHVTVTLDPHYYATVDLLQSHFPHGAPSLVNCKSFSVKGDVKFGRAVVLRGDVSIVNATSAQAVVEDNAVITGSRIFRSR
jgi:UTP--glucose-1-phosphate uridylyltransferase